MEQASRPIPISVLILTRDEELTLPHTLKQLDAFAEVIVIDSNSTDETQRLARNRGAQVVQFTWNGRYPKKKQWALENAGARYDWVLLLDADEYPSMQLIAELRHLFALESPSYTDSFDIRLTYRFAGKLLRYGHTVTKRSLINRHTVKFPEVGDLTAPGIREVEGHYQPQGLLPPKCLHHKLIHDDRDPVSTWFERHNRYSDWEAHLRRHRALRREVASRRTPQGRLFDRLPGKPVAFFIYSFFIRGGFLDGRAGLDYAVALSVYYWQIGLKVRELRRLSRDPSEVELPGGRS
jgi:glycosyltransferase involved in cell wall biosynthesis